MKSIEASLCLDIILQAMVAEMWTPNAMSWQMIPSIPEMNRVDSMVRGLDWVGGNRFSCPSKIEQSLSSRFFILLQSMVTPFPY